MAPEATVVVSGLEPAKIAASDPKSEPARAPAPRPAAAATSKASPPESPPRPVRDEQAAAAEISLGMQALSSASWKKAAQHFHTALEHDPGSHAAVGGLAEAHFELGEFAVSVRFGKRAVAMAPKKAAYRITLADAYRRLLRYADARREYEKAQELGSAVASGRLRKLDEITNTKRSE